MSVERSIEGSCFCGAVRMAVRGEPAAMGFCHCESCRHWSASPVNAFTLWKPESVQITRGEERLGKYAKSPGSVRKWCTTCGGHVMTEHPQLGLIDVFAGVLPGLAFSASVHVNYQDTVLPIRDGLPKLRDFPKEMGGSGLTLPE